MTEAPDPRREYETRLRQRRAQLDRHNLVYRRIAGTRLVVVGILAIVVWLVFGVGVLTPWWLLVPSVIFPGLMALHSRIDQRRQQLRQAISFYERGLSRIEDRWTGTGEPGEAFESLDHLYAADLDLFGRGSLFELLSTARTRAGEETLARWLCQPAGCREVLARQEAVIDLRDRLDLREDLATLGPDLRSRIHLDRLVRWASAPPTFRNTWLPGIATSLTLITLVTLAYAVFFGGIWVYYISLAGPLAFLLILRKRAGAVLSDAQLPQAELELASGLISRLETEVFPSTRLTELRSSFAAESGRVSDRIRRLVRFVERHRSLKSADVPLTVIVLFLTGVLAPFSLIFLLLPGTAFAIEKWRQRYGEALGSWILAIGEFEALMALSGYAYEHPSDPFPQIVESHTVLDGIDLTHPLLPASNCIPNSVRLGEGLQLVVVSGSNMSGKSTLLRTVGINTVLALAGAPVRGRSFRVSPLAIGCTLRIQDSLQTGTSRFYSEITRIRDIMTLTSGPLAVLFLLDELLHGTNSHDRAIGAEGIVRGLIDRGAIGLATTHDLALARVGEALGSRAINVHFEDRIENGRMVFDYRMKPGIIRKSNALELMRSVGLDV